MTTSGAPGLCNRCWIWRARERCGSALSKRPSARYVVPMVRRSCGLELRSGGELFDPSHPRRRAPGPRSRRVRAPRGARPMEHVAQEGVDLLRLGHAPTPRAAPARRWRRLPAMMVGTNQRDRGRAGPMPEDELPRSIRMRLPAGGDGKAGADSDARPLRAARRRSSAAPAPFGARSARCCRALPRASPCAASASAGWPARGSAGRRRVRSHTTRTTLLGGSLAVSRTAAGRPAARRARRRASRRRWRW